MPESIPECVPFATGVVRLDYDTLSYLPAHFHTFCVTHLLPGFVLGLGLGLWLGLGKHYFNKLFRMSSFLSMTKTLLWHRLFMKSTDSRQ